MIVLGRQVAIAVVALCLVLAASAQAGQITVSTGVAQTVRIESDPGVVLAGELTVPSVAKAPAPAVLLLGGGGRFAPRHLSTFGSAAPRKGDRHAELR